MDLNTGIDCIRACIFELKKRFLINMVDFTVYLIDKSGTLDVSKEFNEPMAKKN
jgi:hypothetical protein